MNPLQLAHTARPLQVTVSPQLLKMLPIMVRPSYGPSSVYYFLESLAPGNSSLDSTCTQSFCLVLTPLVCLYRVLTVVDPSLALLDSLHSVTLKDSVDRDLGSPFPPRGVKGFTRTEHQSIVGRDFALPSGQSPSTQQSSKHPSTSPVLKDRYEQIKHSPTWRHDGRFVRNCEPNSREDPFVTSRTQTMDATSTSECVLKHYPWE